MSIFGVKCFECPAEKQFDWHKYHQRVAIDFRVYTDSNRLKVYESTRNCTGTEAVNHQWFFVYLGFWIKTVTSHLISTATAVVLTWMMLNGLVTIWKSWKTNWKIVRIEFQKFLPENFEKSKVEPRKACYEAKAFWTLWRIAFFDPNRKNVNKYK